MREFKDIQSFLNFMSGANSRMDTAGTAGLTVAAIAVEKEAKNELGTYQRGNNGPFEDWSELKDSTKKDRVNKGFTENDPGLRTGEMRAHIQHEVSGHAAAVGSDDEILEWFELGTEKQRPRSVLGVAAVHKTNEVVDAISGRVASAMAGMSYKHP